MLSHEITMQLIAKAQQGDAESKSILVEQNMPLVKSLIKRYIGKYTDYDDLIQIAGIGLLKAIDNFSEQYGVRFSTYAVPLIIGEVKRHMRDDGYIKVSRSTKSIANKINKYIDEYRTNNAEDPTLEHLAEKFEMTVADIVFAMDSARMPVSIYDKVDNDNDKSVSLADKLCDNSHILLERNLIIEDMLDKLDSRERQLVKLRYYLDMTQAEIATIMQISQVQVSRLEYKIIQKLRQHFDS